MSGHEHDEADDTARLVADLIEGYRARPDHPATQAARDDAAERDWLERHPAPTAAVMGYEPPLVADDDPSRGD